MSASNDTATTDVPRHELPTTNDKPEEYTNRRTGLSCAKPEHVEGDAQEGECGREVLENQHVKPVTRERVKPELARLTDSQRERLRSEGIGVTETVREWETETEVHCPIHGLNVRTA